MSATISKTPAQRKQERIFNTLLGLVDLPETEIKRIDDLNKFEICHSQEFVPNFEFVWCTIKEQYRVYIKVAGTSHGKTNAGYTICTISSSLAATVFVVMYQFLID